MFASSLKFRTFISKFGHIKVSKYGGWCSYQSARKSVMIISQLLYLSVLLFFFSLFFFVRQVNYSLNKVKKVCGSIKLARKRKQLLKGEEARFFIFLLTFNYSEYCFQLFFY